MACALRKTPRSIGPGFFLTPACIGGAPRVEAGRQGLARDGSELGKRVQLTLNLHGESLLPDRVCLMTLFPFLFWAHYG